MDETETDWAIMYIQFRIDRKGKQRISSIPGKTWKKGGKGMVEIIKEKSLIKLVASGAERIETPNGEIYIRELDRARCNGVDGAAYRFIRYLRINPPSVGYDKLSQ